LGRKKALLKKRKTLCRRRNHKEGGGGRNGKLGLGEKQSKTLPAKESGNVDSPEGANKHHLTASSGKVIKESVAAGWCVGGEKRRKRLRA